MFRKLDPVRKCQLSAPSGWSQKEMTVTPLVSEEGVKQEVTYLPVSCEKISERQLDPSQVSLEMIIKTGAVIDPRSFNKLMNETDPAVIEKHRDQFDADFYQYVTEHKEEFIKSE